MVRAKPKGIHIKLTEEEFNALQELARSQRKSVTTYVAETIRSHINEIDYEDKPTKDDLFALQKETREAVRKLHEGLCYVSEKLLQKTQTPTFETSKETQEWVLKNVARKE
jgi:predicted DNA-binding protein